jgi:mitotic spindle assembly checkpoint protein MAD2
VNLDIHESGPLLVIDATLQTSRRRHFPTPAAAAIGAPMSHSLTLRESVSLVADFFAFAIQAVLAQRGLYKPEQFEDVKKFGMSLPVTKDRALQKYLGAFLKTLKEMLARGEVRRVVLVIGPIEEEESSKKEGEAEAQGDIVERWTFAVRRSSGFSAAASQTRRGGGENSAPKGGIEDAGGDAESASSGDPHRQATAEVAELIKQITSTVGFLPVLEEACSFDLLVYTDSDKGGGEEEATSPGWAALSSADCEGYLVPAEDREDDRLRSFRTSVHEVTAHVAYQF